jgi:guanylate kinase
MGEGEQRMSSAFPIVVSGPSGVGKSTIVERLLSSDPRLRLAVSATTRPAREREEDGRDYYFVDTVEFIRRRDAGEFVEHAHVHGELYGTLRSEVDDWLQQGQDVVLDIDYQGGLALRGVYDEAVSIFILPPSLEHLEKRLRGRKSDGEAQIAARLEVASREIEQAEHYDFAVVNHDLDTAFETVRAIVRSERTRVRRIDAQRLRHIARPASPA